jgi:hypothetical protein
MRRRWLAAPALHFAALGALVFALERAAGSIGGHPAPPSAASDAELLEREARRLGLARGDSVIRRRLERNLRFLEESGPGAADFEEALALGLDRSDLVVRRRLVQRLELHALAWARASEPTEAELERRLARDADRFALPARVRLSHVFLSRDRHGAGLLAAAHALAARLDSLAPERAAELGDPSLQGARLPWLSEAELAASFGEPFARAVAELPTGRWSGPIASSYGLHHVFVHERSSGRTAALAQVRSAVREAVFEERSQAVLRDWLRALRAGAE